MNNKIDWKKELQDAWNTVILNKSTMQHIAQDKSKTTFAYYIIIISALLSFIGSQIFPVMLKPTFLSGFLIAIIQIAGAIIFIYIMSFIAKKIFNGKAKHDELFRVMGYGMAITWIGLIPHLSFIGGLWVMVVMFVVLKSIHKLTIGGTIGTLIISSILTLVILGILGIFFPIYSTMGLTSNTNDYMKMNGKEFKMNTKDGTMEMKGNTMKIKTKDGQSIEYTIPNMKK